MSDIELAGMWRRFAALMYEGVLLFAILFVAGYLFVAIVGRSPAGIFRWIFFAYLLGVCGAYFVFCWTRSGQTLAQKTWDLQIISRDGNRLDVKHALLRYVAAAISTGSIIGFLWAFFDREKQFLHDRLVGSRIIVTARQ